MHYFSKSTTSKLYLKHKLRKQILLTLPSISIQTLITYSTLAFCLSSPCYCSSFTATASSSSNKLIFFKRNNCNNVLAGSTHPFTLSSTTPSFLFRRDRHNNNNKNNHSSNTSMTLSNTSSNNMNDNNTSGDWKLNSLRSKMNQLNIDAYLIPTDDPHLSEYVPKAYMRRAFLTGFKGSAGTALVLMDRALLWTDSRYFNEASLQLDPNHWELMKQGLPKVQTIPQFLAELAKQKYEKDQKPLRIGIDPFVHPASFPKSVLDECDKVSKDNFEQDDDDIIPIAEFDTLDQSGNLIDEIWGDERPPIPTSPFRVHPLEYSGMKVTDKISHIREQMKEKKATLSVFAALDDIAYLFNIRAKGDVDTCPVGIAYATISQNEATIFCDPIKVESHYVQSHFKDSGVTIKPYNDIIPSIQHHLESTKGSAKIWMDQKRANYALSRLIVDHDKNLIDSQDAITPMKACKNAAEMEGMRRAHIVDGAAMAHFIAWLENAIVHEGRSVSEVEIDKVLTNYRAQQPGFVEVSFPTIAGVGSNGAIIHYRASDKSDLLKYLDKTKSLLLDSGGQYEYGTTDVTRTWHFGEGSSEFIDNYTRVLKGNIGVDSMIFPENTPGFVLDVFARKALWEAGKDYGHGTGHGVGAALNVHEGPHSISPRWANTEVLKKGMVVSNEPGYYEDGNFGIRIENLLEITYVNEEDNEAYDKKLKEGDEGYPVKDKGMKTFLKFNKLTMIPIQKSLINTSIMTVEELDWLDAYHQEVFDKVSPLLEEGSPGMKWLIKACAKIDR